MTRGSDYRVAARAGRTESSVERIADAIGNLCVSMFHYLALFAIGAATVWAAAHAFFDMVQAGRASIEDLLLLFIYLEIGAMVGIYFKTNHMPVRFLLYVGITAVTRLLIDIVNVKHESGAPVIYLAGAIAILALAVLILRAGSYYFPSDHSVAGPKGRHTVEDQE